MVTTLPLADTIEESPRLPDQLATAEPHTPASPSGAADVPAREGGQPAQDDSTMDLELGSSPMLLADVQTDFLKGVPELETGWQQRYQSTVAPAPSPGPAPSCFPGMLPHAVANALLTTAWSEWPWHGAEGHERNSHCAGGALIGRTPPASALGKKPSQVSRFSTPEPPMTRSKTPSSPAGVQICTCIAQMLPSKLGPV